MPTQLNTLPCEILGLVSTYTNKPDLLNALLVSKSWYNALYSYVYTSVSLDSTEKLHRVLSCFKKQHLPGYLVRQLTLLQQCQLSEDDMKDLIYLFPNINQLRLDWSVWPKSISFADHFDSRAPISFIHPPQGLHPALSSFFLSVGPSLKILSINAQHCELTDVWSILESCRYLQHLELLNLGHEHIVTLGYIERIHNLCPYLTLLKIKCVRSDPDNLDLMQDILIQPVVSLQCFSISSISGAAKWPLWLPYFAVKYPHLEHLLFKHTGIGRDGLSFEKVVPHSVYDLFNQHCPRLKSLRWQKIVVHNDQQQKLFAKPKKNLKRIEAYEDFAMAPNSLLNSTIFQSPMSRLLTSLTLGQPPASVAPVQILTALGECPNLSHLTIQECSHEDVTYAIDDILKHCRHVVSLVLKDVHISCNHSCNQVEFISTYHPLKTLVMKRASFTDGVFPMLSHQCLHLSHVELIGCVQTDRRDQVTIGLSRQRLSTLKIQGLRTRRYYVGCRIRFFAVNNEAWYYMTAFDISPYPIGRKRAFFRNKLFQSMEYAQRLVRLDERDIQELSSLVTTETLKGWDIELAKRHLKKPFTEGIDPSGWDPENIYYSGLVQINCLSVQNLFINDKRIT